MTTYEELERKLDPRRFTAMSGRMAAILACILRTDRWRTEPAIAELYVTSGGGLLVRHAGDVGANDFIGAVADLDDNLSRLATIAGLTEDEQALLIRLRREATTDFRRQAVSR